VALTGETGFRRSEPARRNRTVLIEELNGCAEGDDMSFALYMIGLALLAGGVAWGLITAGIAAIYVGITMLIVVGIGVMMAVSRTRAKDPPVT
jgi:hypothetical protein